MFWTMTWADAVFMVECRFMLHYATIFQRIKLGKMIEKVRQGLRVRAWKHLKKRPDGAG